MGAFFSSFSTPKHEATDALKFHPKARGCFSDPKFDYAMNLASRFPVPDNKVNFSINFKEYQPVEFTATEVLKNPPWADPSDPTTVSEKFNAGKRISHKQQYKIDEQGRPINPVGRTGMTGRGLLGKWGPNHAADPLVTRFRPGTGVGFLENEKICQKFHTSKAIEIISAILLTSVS